MRVLQVTDAFWPRLGGIEAHVAGLALAQRQAGDDVAIFTTTLPSSGGRGRTLEILTPEGLRPAAAGPPGLAELPVFRAAETMPLQIPVHPAARRHLRELVARFDPEVVHFHMGGLTPSVQTSLGAAAGRGRVLEVHSVWTPAVVKTYRALNRLTGFPPPEVLLAAVSSVAGDPVAEATGRPVTVIPNGVDLAGWRVSPRAHAGTHAVAAIRFAPRKRPDALLRILKRAAALLGPGHELTATVAGEGPSLEDAREWVRQEGLDWIHLPGRLSREELRELYAGADIYLSAGILEAFPVAVLEARAAGLAVVAHADSGSREQIEHGASGLIAVDDEGMARAVAHLASEPGELARITATNRDVPPPFDWPTIVERNREAYRAAIAQA